VIPKLALRAQTAGIAFLSLRQDLRIKNVSMSAQKDFCLGNNPFSSGGDRGSRIFFAGECGRAGMPPLIGH